MTSSRSSSGKVAAALALGLAACAHRASPAAAPAPTLIAVFPVQNASGGNAPIRALGDALEEALAKRGIPTVPRRDVEAFLARNRFRFTGGVDRKMAQALRDEGIEVVLVPTLEQYAAPAPPRLALALRIVETRPIPTVAWAELVARSGDDSPGLLGLGVVERFEELERQVVAAAAASVEGWTRTRARGEPCARDARFEPRRQFRAPVLDDVGRRTVAVLPFRNETPRRGADEVVANELLAQLTRSGSFEVLDPAVVREQLLEHRLVLEGGVSIDRAMTILDLVQADLIVSGVVQLYSAPAGSRTAPTVGFSAFVIDRESAELVWSSSSVANGEDGVFLFGSGRIASASALACRMTRGVVDGIAGARRPLSARDGVAPPQPVRAGRGPAQFPRSRPGANRRELDE